MNIKYKNIIILKGVNILQCDTVLLCPQHPQYEGFNL